MHNDTFEQLNMRWGAKVTIKRARVDFGERNLAVLMGILRLWMLGMMKLCRDFDG